MIWKPKRRRENRFNCSTEPIISDGWSLPRKEVAATLAFEIPGGLCVLRGGQVFEALMFRGSPFLGDELPPSISGERILDSGAHFGGRQTAASQFLDSGQGRRVRALGQEDGAMLKQGTALPALGAAHDFGIPDDNVAGRELLETKDLRGMRVRSGRMQTGGDSKLLQSRRNDRVHSVQ